MDRSHFDRRRTGMGGAVSPSAGEHDGGGAYTRRGALQIGLGQGVDVSLAAASKGVYAVWSSQAGLKALLPGRSAPVAVAPRGAFPSVVGLPDGRALAAWEEDGKIVVHPLP